MAELTTSYQLIDEAHVLSDSYGSLYVRIYARRGNIDYANGKCVVYYRAETRYTSTYIQDASGSLSVGGSGASGNSTGATYITGSSPTAVETSATVSYNANGTYSGSASASLSMPNWGKSATASGSFTLPAIAAPDAPTACTNTRNSDTKNAVSWTRGANAGTVYTAQHVERSVDGGVWSQIATVAATATSYVDSATSANHSYAYRVRAKGFRGYSAYATSGTTYNTPAAPTAVKASRTGETGVSLAIVNPANTATALEIQRSTNGTSWATISTPTGKVTSATDTPGGGTFYYRARNTRGSLVSAWSPTSNAVVTVTPPNAPTLKAPASGAVLATSASSITFEWAHNPIDGSAQTAAQLQYSTNGGSTWTTVEVSGNAQSKAVSMLAANSTVTWRVRTKGAHADYGGWSGTRVFYCYAEPTVYFARPSSGAILENMPLSVSIVYDDVSGTLAAATFAIQKDGATVYTRDLGTQTAFEVTAADFLPENGASYTLRVDVRSSSSLSAYAIRDITVDYALPIAATLDVSPDPETGYVGLQVGIPSNLLHAEGEVITVEDAAENARVETLTLSGNMQQVTTSGKNLYNPAADNMRNLSHATELGGGWWRLSYDNSAGASNAFCNIWLKLIDGIEEGRTYYAVVEAKNLAFEGATYVPFVATSQNNADVDQFGASQTLYITEDGASVVLLPPKSSEAQSIMGMRSFITVHAGISASVDIRISLRADEPDMSTWSYEPYTGGSPSPSTEYPQHIYTVGGNLLTEPLVQGAYLSSDGAFASLGLYVCTAKIPIRAGKTVTFSSDYMANHIISLYWDSSGKYLGYDVTGNTPGVGAYKSFTATTPATAAFVAFDIAAADYSAGSGTPITPSEVTNPRVYVTPSVEVQGVNLLDGLDWEQGSVGGGIIGSSFDESKVDHTARVRIADLVSVKSGMSLSCNGGYQLFVDKYDANGRFVGNMNGWIESFTFSADAPAYIAFALRAADNRNITTEVLAEAKPQLIVSTSTPIDLDGNELAALPDGTRDELTVDEAGNVVLVKRVGKVVPTASNIYTVGTIGGHKYAHIVADLGYTTSNVPSSTSVISDRYVTSIDQSVEPRCYRTYNAIIVVDDRFTDVATARSMLTEELPTFYLSTATEQRITLPTVAYDPSLPYPHFTMQAETTVPVPLDLTYTNGFEAASSVSIYRVHDGNRVLVAEGLSDGGAAVDKYAPLNVPYQYEAVSFAASGAPNAAAFPAAIRTPWWFIYWGNEIARGKWNPSGNIRVTRPEKRRVWYAGRPDPVSYDSEAVSEERSLSLHIKTKAEADSFAKMARDGGRGVYKSADGDVMHADVDVSLKPAYMQPTYYGEVELSIVKIDGEVL